MENRYRIEYTSRINRVIDYINQNISEPLDLETLAGVAAFSKFHFHKVFGSIAGESIGSYISRLRLEKAAAAVAGPEGKPITDIAMDLGYSSLSVFSRSFREYFGMSPAQWRDGGWKEYGKNRKLQSNRYQPADNYRKASEISMGYDQYNKRKWIVVKSKKIVIVCVSIRKVGAVAPRRGVAGRRRW